MLREKNIIDSLKSTVKECFRRPNFIKRMGSTRLDKDNLISTLLHNPCHKLTARSGNSRRKTACALCDETETRMSLLLLLYSTSNIKVQDRVKGRSTCTTHCQRRRGPWSHRPAARARGRRPPPLPQPLPPCPQPAPPPPPPSSVPPQPSLSSSRCTAQANRRRLLNFLDLFSQQLGECLGMYIYVADAVVARR